MTLAHFTERQLLVPRLRSSDQAGAINELITRLDKAGSIDDSLAFFQAVMQREYVMSTWVLDGVAFPHARGKGARSLCFAVGLSRDGVAWGKDQTAHALFLLAVPTSGLSIYLELVGVLARLVRDELEFGRLRQCVQPDDMWRVLEDVPVDVPSATRANP